MIAWIVGTLGGKATALAIIVAIIGLAGALGGAFSTYIVARRTLYVNTITAERMKWVTTLRNNVASLVSHTTFIHVAQMDRSKVSDDKLSDTFALMTQLAKTIELQLNPAGHIDKNIILILEEMYKATGINQSIILSSLSKSLVAHSQWLLKDEWERVKYEARGLGGKLLSSYRSRLRRRSYLIFVQTDQGKVPVSMSEAVKLRR